MCNCPSNVTTGSYGNVIVVPIPDHMSTYRDNRVATGLSDKVSIDKCLIDEVQALWQKGIRTTGCCCGHNRRDPYIGVFPEDVQKMKDLGYQVQFNPYRPYAQDTFYPSSVARRPLRSENTDHLPPIDEQQNSTAHL